MAEPESLTFTLTGKELTAARQWRWSHECEIPNSFPRGAIFYSFTHMRLKMVAVSPLASQDMAVAKLPKWPHNPAHHREFLAGGDRDPRRKFAETLIEALDRFDGPIIVYSSYERTRLQELVQEFLDLASSLSAIIARLADLLPIVRGAVYLPGFWFNRVTAIAECVQAIR